MPRGPKGEKRPADVIGNAVHVMQARTLQKGRSTNFKLRHYPKKPPLDASGRYAGVKP
jgi:hypothetical protein